MLRNEKSPTSSMDRTLGALGLLLIGLTGWAAERLDGRRSARTLARLVLAIVAGIGKTVDRLMPSAVSDAQPTARRLTPRPPSRLAYGPGQARQRG